MLIGRCQVGWRLSVLAMMLPGGCAEGEKSGAPELLDLDRVLRREVAENGGYGGGVLRAESPEGLRYLGASGERTVGGAAITPDDTFEIASITKTFTATVTMLLIEEGRLSLDDTLADVLPEHGSGLLIVGGEDRTAEVTVRQLLNHTSGLPDYWSDPPFVRPQTNAFLRDFLADTDHLWTPEEILSYAEGLDAIHAPGGAWHYADTNYVLLGLIIERLEAEPLHDTMRHRIFGPLGMDQTWMSFREDRPLPDAHRYEDRWDQTDKLHQSADWAGGGLISSAADLSAFLRALSSGGVFADAATLDAMRAAVPTGEPDIGYGLGVFVVALSGDATLWGHDGYGNSFMYLNTGDGTIFSGTLNQTGNDWWPLVREGL